MKIFANIILLSRFFRQLMKNIDYYLPAEIKILLILIIIFTVLAITFFCVIIFSRFYKNYREKKMAFLKQKIELLITSFVFDENNVDYENVRKRQKLILHYKENYLKTKFARQVLLDEIIKLYKDLIGSPADNLRQLYLNFGLDTDSMKKLKDHRWHIKAKGIKEISQMNIKGGYVELYKLINHSNQTLRMEAQLALVRLVNFDALRFLDDAKYPISEWQQINLLGVLSSLQNQNLPDFSRWLKSKNESVVLFALKMIIHFSCLDFIKEVIKMLNHESLKVRKATIDAIGELDAASALSLLKKRFYGYEKDFKMEVLRVSGKIAIEKDFPFLELQLLSEDFDISKASATALASKGNSGKKFLSEIHDSYADEKLKIIIQNAINNNLN